jgi:uncharacterized protein (DUF1778 family)
MVVPGFLFKNLEVKMETNRKRIVRFRVSDAEYAMIKRLAAVENRRVSEFIRETLRHAGSKLVENKKGDDDVSGQRAGGH